MSTNNLKLNIVYNLQIKKKCVLNLYYESVLDVYCLFDKEKHSFGTHT